jgi:hypothetical protein
MTNPPQSEADQPPARTRRPGSVATAMWIQILLALAIVASAVSSALYGADAQSAAEEELAAQGVDLSEVPEGTFAFEQGTGTLVFNIVVALGLIVLAVLNGAGKRPARIITWVVQPLVLICGAVMFTGQLFGEQLMQYAVDNSGSSGLEDVDVAAVVQAAYEAYPAWTQVVSYIVLALTTVGSLAVIILLALPASNAFFRKQQAQTYIPGAPPA